MDIINDGVTSLEETYITDMHMGAIIQFEFLQRAQITTVEACIYFLVYLLYKTIYKLAESFAATTQDAVLPASE